VALITFCLILVSFHVMYVNMEDYCVFICTNTTGCVSIYHYYMEIFVLDNATGHQLFVFKS
jgi:hypothetical protein